MASIFSDICAQDLSRLGGSMRFSYLIITYLSLGFLLHRALFFLSKKNLEVGNKFLSRAGAFRV
jgi:hypothetical protein